MRHGAALLTAALLAACSQDKPAATPPSAPPVDTSIPPEAARWFPVEDDVVLAFDTEDLVTKSKGVFMLRVRRVGGGRIELAGPKRTERLSLSAAGIMREAEGTFLLKLPINPGATWPAGPNASLGMGRTNFAVKVKAGEFDGCVETIEKKSGAVSGTLTTTFCPNVGIVRIETKGEGKSKSGAGAGGDVEIHEVVELRSFQKAVDLGPPGVTQTEVKK